MRISFEGFICLSVVAACGILLQRPVIAQEKPIIALFDMEDKESGISTKVLSKLTDLLAIYLAENGYQVIPRDQLRTRLRAQKTESQKQCYDQSCQVELGRELAATKSVSTQIIKMGGTCHLTAALLDLKRATTEKAASAKAECSEIGLSAGVEEIAKKLQSVNQLSSSDSKSQQPKSGTAEQRPSNQSISQYASSVEEDPKCACLDWATVSWSWQINGRRVCSSGAECARYHGLKGNECADVDKDGSWSCYVSAACERSKYTADGQRRWLPCKPPAK